jgi:hypothetical protein
MCKFGCNRCCQKLFHKCLKECMKFLDTIYYCNTWSILSKKIPCSGGIAMVSHNSFLFEICWWIIKLNLSTLNFVRYLFRNFVHFKNWTVFFMLIHIYIYEISLLPTTWCIFPITWLDFYFNSEVEQSSLHFVSKSIFFFFFLLGSLLKLSWIPEMTGLIDEHLKTKD